jgi:uncharacterized protein YyaL (SSP411 family)
MQAEFRVQDLQWAQALADLLLEQFEDAQRGGFYFVSHDHERLVHRPKSGHDNAAPSGNGVAAFALQRLGHLTGERRYIVAAERTLKLFHEDLRRSPSGYTSLLCALEEALVPPRVIVLRGEPDSIALWRTRLAKTYRPDTLVLAIAAGVSDLPSSLDKKDPHDPGATAAWVCEGTSCLPPVFELASLEESLASCGGVR